MGQVAKPRKSALLESASYLVAAALYELRQEGVSPEDSEAQALAALINSLTNLSQVYEKDEVATQVSEMNLGSSVEQDQGTWSGITPGSGLERALRRLQDARAARRSFLGGASPDQAIDKIVREFNK